MGTRSVSIGDLLTPAEVASAFRVDPKTVTRWARAGKLRSIKTPGGHRRYLVEDVEALLGVRKSRCWKCSRVDGEIVDRGPTFGRERYMHAYGNCPTGVPAS